MAPPPLSMEPTGWFQVAWSPEITVGAVHKMKYFRPGDGGLAVRIQAGCRCSTPIAEAPRCAPRIRRARRGGENLVCRSTAGNGNADRPQCVCRHETPQQGPDPQLSDRRTQCGRGSGTTLSAGTVFDVFDIFADFPMVRPPTTTIRRFPPRPLPSRSGAASAVRDGERRRLRAPSCTRRRSCLSSPATISVAPTCRTSTSPSPSRKVPHSNQPPAVRSINAGLGVSVTRSWG